MKILLLSDCNSVHTIKWAKSLYSKGVDVIVFSIGVLRVSDYEGTNIRIYASSHKVSRENIANKLSYITIIPKLKRVIKKEKPDILHAHYATSYGLLGSLANFHPYIISVWGSDVFDFPNKSVIHKKILKHNLRKADKILSTSKVMAKETQKYTNKSIEVTPFGVDLDVFCPYSISKASSLFSQNDIVIGTIKSLEKKYGIEYLIDAFSLVLEKRPHLPLKLLIVGEGSLDNSLKEQVKRLQIQDKVIFKGKIPFSEVPKYHNMISVYVALSILNSESFGVAIVEASAMEMPVIVSDVGGLPEVVEHRKTGIVVPPKNSEAAARAILEIIDNETLREKMGKLGRLRVCELYDWNKNVELMLSIYNKIISS